MLRCTQHDNALAFLPRWQDESIPACHPEHSKASSSGSGCFTTYSATINNSLSLTVAHVPQNAAQLRRHSFLDCGSASGTLADGLHLRVLVQGLFHLLVRRLQVEHDLLHGACKDILSLVLVGAVDDEAVVAANVHARVGRESNRNRVRHPTLANLLVVRPQRDVATGARLVLVGL